ncbi:MAG TPA: sigma-70 family RNA polymerase sigma factor [Longimicrobiaceae bacterium]|nr:sigma-70 family RNA polymerase sigma factor [Longimicrobiaceae bacterium]
MTEELGKEGFAAEAMPHLEAVHRFALRLAAGEEDEAGDLVQETYLRAYRAWEGFARGTNCRAWLFTICRNVFLRARERRGRMVEVSPDAEPAVEALAVTTGVWEAMDADPERAFFDSFVDRDVLREVDRLPPPFREAVVLVDLEGFSYAEACELLGLPPGTVKSRLYRGRRLLQQALYQYALEMGYVKPERRA